MAPAREMLSFYIYTHTHTHTHIHIYIYIHIYICILFQVHLHGNPCTRDAEFLALEEKLKRKNRIMTLHR
jgi:hypothetical protein